MTATTTVADSPDIPPQATDATLLGERVPAPPAQR